MRHHQPETVASPIVGSLTVRISDDLHAAARKAAAGQSLTGFVREAIAEKVGRAELTVEVEQLRKDVADIKRQLQALSPR